VAVPVAAFGSEAACRAFEAALAGRGATPASR
jgi:hypothetical protein